IQRTARDLLDKRLRPDRVRGLAACERYDADVWREVVELGWPAIATAEALGGAGLGVIELAVLQEELGRALAPLPFASTVAAALALEHAGSDAQREHWLAGLLSGDLRGAVGVARDGVAELVIDGTDADFVILAGNDHARLYAVSELEVTPQRT